MIKNIFGCVRNYLIRRKVRRIAAAAASVYETLGAGLQTFSPIAEEVVVVFGQVAAQAANDPKVETAVTAMVEAFGPHIVAAQRRLATLSGSPDMAAVMAAAQVAAEKYMAATVAMVTAVMPDAPSEE